MWGNVLAEAAAFPDLAASRLHGAGGDVLMGTPGGKQPGTTEAEGAEVGAKNFEQTGGKHGVTVFAALAMLDAQEHALTVDIGRFEGDGFGDAKTGA